MQSHLVVRGSSLCADIADYWPMVIVVDTPAGDMGRYLTEFSPKLVTNIGSSSQD